ncbi:MAG: endonuclease III [Candidatus Omnitrophica bacterium]|nr:endonuclease III [Candidatus Omnitrophota bacterium]
MDKKKTQKIYKVLTENYFHEEAFLVNSNPFQLLVATILSAQCTDKRVNMVTRDLFKKYRTVKDYASADQTAFEKDIRSTGFYRNKAKNIISAANIIIKQYGGKVPNTMDELVTLPGVARKTANIVLFHGYGKREGIAVDTHVKRVSYRLGMTGETDPVKIERDLMALFSEDKWGRLNNLIIEHGRKICDARKPLCTECVLEKLCPKAGVDEK